MKKTFVLFVITLALMLSQSYAQVERDMVILEIGTGTWCQYCPGAAMGADDLIANGKDVAVIEYHSGDEYQNTYSTSRISYYSIGSFPTAKFDGVLSKAGGSNTQSMYTSYLPLYNQRKAINSSFAIDITGELYSITDYSVSVTVEKVANYTGSNLKLHFVLTESHIEKSWQGMDELNFVARLMVPNQNGTTLDFSSGNTQTVELEFSLEEDWNFEKIEVVAFVQDNSTKEILQGTKMPLTEFLPAFNNNASVDIINNIPVENCSETVIPIVKIRNNGSDALTSLSFEYKVNEEQINTHTWAGNLAFAETELVELPEVSFTLLAENTVTVTSAQPNGQSDEYPENDTKDSEVFTVAFPTPITVKLMLRTDKNPEETSWDVRNSQNEIIFSGGGYTQANQNVIENFDFAEQDCYTFNIYDEGEDGLIAPGFYMLMHGNNIIMIQGTSFGEEESIQFGAGGFVGLDDQLISEELTIYPNPSSEASFFRFDLKTNSTVSLTLFSSNGVLVHSLPAKNYNSGNNELELDTEKLPAGLYYACITINGKQLTQKISVIK